MPALHEPPAPTPLGTERSDTSLEFFFFWMDTWPILPPFPLCLSFQPWNTLSEPSYPLPPGSNYPQTANLNPSSLLPPSWTRVPITLLNSSQNRLSSMSRTHSIQEGKAYSMCFLSPEREHFPSTQVKKSTSESSSIPPFWPVCLCSQLEKFCQSYPWNDFIIDS